LQEFLLCIFLLLEALC